MRYVLFILSGALLSLSACDCEDGAQLPTQDQGGTPSLDMRAELRDAKADLDQSTPSKDMRGASDQGVADQGKQEDQGPSKDQGAPQDMDPLSTPYEAFCQGQGGIPIGQTATQCGGELAQTTFRYALCLCEDLTTAGGLQVDAFDSTTMMNAQGGSVGLNGRLSAQGEVNTGGALLVGAGISANNKISAGLDLRCIGDINASGLQVARNLSLSGNIVTGALEVGGTLSQPAGGNISAQSQQVNMRDQQPAMVEPPCDCSESTRISLEPVFDRVKALNDNAMFNIDAAGFGNLQGDQTLELPCGRFYFDRWAGSGKLTIKLQGRAAIFVAADVALSGGLEIIGADDQSLDLFIGGNIVVSGPFKFGDISRPQATRLYVNGTGTINLSAMASFAGNIYAPRAELVLASGRTEIYGSVFAKRINTSNDLVIHHDVGVLDASDECQTPMTPPDEDMGQDMSTTPDQGMPPGPTCDSCRDCGNQGCGADGQCGGCRRDPDCCSPFVCWKGACHYFPG